MNKYPEFLEVKGKRYKINTDFRYALKCDEIFRDDTICDYEKTLAIIYTLLGNEGLNDYQNHEQIVKLITKYLMCGKEVNAEEKEELPSMDFKQDEGYIKASFQSDYKISLVKVEMHWWEFHDLLQGLTDNSILTRVRAIREEPLSGKKGKERQKWEKLKDQVALKYDEPKTEKEKEIDRYWEEIMKKR